MIYLDYNATAPLDKRVLEKMMPYLTEIYSNPSSVYRFAQESRKAMEGARSKVADLLSANPEEIIFTSGGTESNNTALKGIAFYHANKGKHIITSKIEHHAVLNPCKFLEKLGYEVTYLGVDQYGVVDLGELERKIRKDTILVSIMYANNEIGTIQPIKEIAKITKEKGVIFHTDAVQAVGKIAVNVRDLGVDLLSISSHKLYGSKGVGALYVRRGVRFEPHSHGGHHEKNRRAGTENVAGVVGLGEAAQIAKNEMQQDEQRIKVLRDKLQAGIMKEISDVKLNGHPQNRLDNTLNICIRYIEGESILINLDFEGICASSGSACTSGSLEPSHVLLALGIPAEVAHGSLRFSLGKYNTEADINKVLEVLPPIVVKLRKMSPFGKDK